MIDALSRWIAQRKQPKRDSYRLTGRSRYLCDDNDPVTLWYIDLGNQSSAKRCGRERAGRSDGLHPQHDWRQSFPSKIYELSDWRLCRGKNLHRGGCHLRRCVDQTMVAFRDLTGPKPANTTLSTCCGAKRRGNRMRGTPPGLDKWRVLYEDDLSVRSGRAVSHGRGVVLRLGKARSRFYLRVFAATTSK